MVKLFRKIYDPNKTVKHVSFRELRAEHKRREQRFVRFWTTAFWVLMLAMLILFFAERLGGLS